MHRPSSAQWLIFCPPRTVCRSRRTAHDHLGLIYKETELFERAMEQYKLAIMYGPKDCPAKEHLAVVLTDYGTRLKLAGSTEKAVQSYTEALQIHDAYWPAYFNLGVVHSERREFDLAMKHYQLAIDRNPNYVEALCNIGVIYKNSGELALSIEYYDRALKANPNFAIANSNLSIALTDMGTQVKNEGRLDEGIAYYKRALHHHSKYPAAWYKSVAAAMRRHVVDDTSL
jgi:protein O-GlcNAc transferase